MGPPLFVQEQRADSLPPGRFIQAGQLCDCSVWGRRFRQPLAQGNTPNSPATRDELLRQLGPTKTLRSGASQSLQTGMTKSWIWPAW